MCDPNRVDVLVGGGTGAREVGGHPDRVERHHRHRPRRPVSDRQLPVRLDRADGGVTAAVCSASPFVTFNTPGVYTASPVDLVLQVAFSDCAGASTAWLTNTSTTISLIIQPRPQQVAILLDRSGSMSGDRWTNAVASARAIVRLFSTFRAACTPVTGSACWPSRTPVARWAPARCR